jgi:hypothetical protein
MQQFKSSITCPTNSNLVESEGIKRVLERVHVIDNSTVPPPVTGYISPLAFDMAFRRGTDFVLKSL